MSAPPVPEIRPYEGQFDPGLDIAGAPAPRRTLIIASTPRSGSHMLGHAMTATDAMGRPFEYVAPLNLAEWKRRLGSDDLETVLGRIVARRTTANGVFAIKVHYEHLPVFGGLDGLLARFPDPVVIRMVRADLLRQAISASVARQTGVWISGMQGNGRTPFYSRAAIRDELERTALHNARWASALAERGIAPLTVEFDEVVRDTQGTLQSLARYAGIDLAGVALPETPVTRKQGSGRTEEWLARYAGDFRAHSRRARLTGLPRRLWWRLRS